MLWDRKREAVEIFVLKWELAGEEKREEEEEGGGGGGWGGGEGERGRVGRDGEENKAENSLMYAVRKEDRRDSGSDSR